MKDLLILLFLTMIISYSLCGYDYYGCSEFENVKIGFCNYLDAGEDNKVCNIINGKCTSTYRDCEDYKEDVKKDICESIIPYSNVEKNASLVIINVFQKKELAQISNLDWNQIQIVNY